MAFTLLVSNKERHNYGMIDAAELAEKWTEQPLTPMDSLQQYGTLINAAMPYITALTKQFLVRYVEPSITDRGKRDQAFDWFSSQFLSGVLLGQILDALILREYYRKKDKA